MTESFFRKSNEYKKAGHLFIKYLGAGKIGFGTINFLT